MNNFQQQSNTITCLIIDDDSFIQDLLQDKIEQHFPELKVLGIGGSGEEGIALIRKYDPDLVFLDVEMSDMTGFEMLSKIDNPRFKTIFITSYNHYAIKAIRFKALDYLLKPFDLGELRNAIQRFKKEAKQHKDSAYNVSVGPLNFIFTNTSDQVLALKTQQGILKLPIKDILFVKGDRNYSAIFLSRGTSEIVSKTLSDLEALLEGKGFFRCHKSYLVNKLHIDSSPNSSLVQLSNKTRIPISRRRKIAFGDWVKKH